MPIFFKSEAHKQRFLTTIQQIGKVYDGKVDPEYGAALYILTSGGVTWQKAQEYVDQDGILIEDMLQATDLSSGEAILISLAGNLFNSQVHIDPVEFMRLDEANFRIAMTALQIRRQSWMISTLEQASV